MQDADDAWDELEYTHQSVRRPHLQIVPSAATAKVPTKASEGTQGGQDGIYVPPASLVSTEDSMGCFHRN